MAREVYISPITFLVLKETGQIPTVPDPPTLRKSHPDFTDLNLEIGEWCRNIVDGKLWFRNESEIVEYSDDLFGPNVSDFHTHDDRYYTKTGMPVASTSVLGLIKVGSNLSMSGEVLNATGGGTAADWGIIGGDISDQTDLQEALALKADQDDLDDGLDLKANIASPTFTGTVSGITKAMVGLGNVDNTADSNKNVATAVKLTTANFTIEQVSGELVVKYGTTIILKITSAGYLKTKDEVEPFAF